MNKKAQVRVGEINDPRPGEKGAKRGKLMGQIAYCNRPGSTIVNEDNTVDVRSEVRK